MGDKPELVTLTIDGLEVKVAPGTNLIEAAGSVGIEVPHYCYHPNLSVAGNCRMCQVEVEGMPKLTIGCNTQVRDGMVVRTHKTSEAVADAQRATLEFILVNHPLDCTVCDQAGHCKLQDYYYEYNGKASRFSEDKHHKVKAEVLGPEVIYDGERCILCTRCVRFCDEVTRTCELGVFNRGGKSIIGIDPSHELDNPFSGTVVDLCPVGALTHRRWRFNTRIWYTSRTHSICPGCSTGCNVDVASRDGEVVQVKARCNCKVNKEWLCDEGRYGFSRFQPKSRLVHPLKRYGADYLPLPWEDAMRDAAALGKKHSAQNLVLVSAALTLEEMWAVRLFAKNVIGVLEKDLVLAYKSRELSELERILISPDLSPNAAGWGLLSEPDFCDRVEDASWRDRFANGYKQAIERLGSGEYAQVLLVGDLSIFANEVGDSVRKACGRAELVVSLSCQEPKGDRQIISSGIETGPHDFADLLLPISSVNESSGVFVNRDLRAQRLKAVLPETEGTRPVWQILQGIADLCGVALFEAPVTSERDIFRHLVPSVPSMGGLSLAGIGEKGVSLLPKKES